MRTFFVPEDGGAKSKELQKESDKRTNRQNPFLQALLFANANFLRHILPARRIYTAIRKPVFVEYIAISERGKRNKSLRDNSSSKHTSMLVRVGARVSFAYQSGVEKILTPFIIRFNLEVSEHPPRHYFTPRSLVEVK